MPAIKVKGKVKAYAADLREDERQYATMDDEIAKGHPVVRIHQRTPEEYGMIYKHIKTGNKLDLSDYAGALLNLLNTFVEDKCEENFSACGLTICEAGANMSPENFLRRDYIKSKNIPKPEIDSVTGMTDPDEQRGLMAMLLAANRMASVYSIVARVDEYATKVIQQIANACKKAAIDPGDVVLGNCEKFAVTVDFMRVLSAADMFFIKFPNHHLSSLRVGTLVMSYKDMSQVNNTIYLRQLTGQPWINMVYYTFESGLLNEFFGIEPGIWYREAYYFPYQSAMRLMGNKYTYYSNTKNPYFHNVVQIVGLMCSSLRAFNSYYVVTPTAMNIAQAIIYLAASTGESSFYEGVFLNVEAGEITIDPEEAAEGDNIPAWEKASEFIVDLKNKADKLSKAAHSNLMAAQKFGKSMGTMRQKSFGQWLSGIDVGAYCTMFYDKMIEGKGGYDPSEESGDTQDEAP